ncbi:MAG: SH3 domain-containing protein [Gemmatimonadota bacterium]|nr:MAG: SH3 domain-containing protein [Gemmatimonadota bacterium]
MKKIYLCLLLLIGSLLWAQTLTIKVKETRVRSSPKFYAKSIYRANRGDTLEKMGEQKGWYEVKIPSGDVGWVHSSAVETKKLKLDSGEWVETEATPEEVALAGKGFNMEVEAEYKRNHPDLDFTWVDRMESIEISEEEMVAFLKKGKLGEYGGEQ